MDADSAARAFAALPREPGLLRFFKRNQGGYCVFDCFGQDAEAVARGSYGDVQVMEAAIVGFVVLGPTRAQLGWIKEPASY